MPRNVEEDFLAAFHRLNARAPLNDELKDRLANSGTIAVNAYTVALEAGHSRTLLAKRAKGYERICALLYPDEVNTDRPIGTVGGSPNGKETVGEKCARLMAENEALLGERDMFATRTAEAYLAISLLQREITSLKAELDRRERHYLQADSIMGAAVI